MINCCEISGKIPSFPQTWRNELEALLCEIINDKQVIDCQSVKDCETLTSFNAFTLNGSTLSISYIDERGVMTTRQQNIASAFVNPYTFNNGITNNSGVVRFGGTLLENTTLNTATFQLNLDGEFIYFNDYPSTRVDINPVNFLFTNSSGKLMSGQLSGLVETVFSAPFTAQNGLNRVLNSVRLGGTLIENTNVNTSTFNLTFDGENIIFDDYKSTRADAGAVNFLFTNSNGKLMSGQLSSLVNTVYSAPLTFNNGLTRTLNNTQLGGDLIQPTVIGGTNTNSELISNNFFIRNHVGIGDLINDGTAARLLAVHYGNNNNNLNTNVLYVDKVFNSNTSSPTTDSFGILGMHSFDNASPGFNLNFTGVNNGGIYAGFNYKASSGNIIGNVYGVVSRMVVGSYQNNTGGDIEKFIGYKIISATQAQLSPTYTGTIGEMVGLEIDDLKTTAYLAPGAAITQAWGIKQEGVNDYNWLKGNTSIGNENVTNDAALITGKSTNSSQNFNFSSKHVLNNFSAAVAPFGINSAIYAANTLYLSTGPSSYIISNDLFETGLYSSINLFNDSNKDVSGIISSITTQGIFSHGITTSGGGTIDKFVGVRIVAPTQLEPTIDYAAKDFTGTITDTYGILIQNQRGALRPSATQTNTWGIYQEGGSDRNHFNGNSSFGPENRNPKCSILTTKYGHYRDEQFPLVAVKSFLSPTTAIGLGDYFAATTSKLDVYESQLAGSGFQNPTIVSIVHNPITSFEGQVTYTSQNADVTAALIGFKSSVVLASGTVELGDPRPSINGGDIETLIGFLATRPLQILDNSIAIAGTYNGIINNTFGVYIESQRSPDATGNPSTGFTQVNTWGIYQAGVDDTNYFAGKMRFANTAIPVYADDTAADADTTLQSGELYRLTGDRTVYVKP